MPPYTVKRGQRYRAEIWLKWWQSGAENETIADKFRQVGFSEVEVVGSGNRRKGKALWPKDDTTAEVPDEVHNIEYDV